MLKNICKLSPSFEKWESQWILENETPTHACKAMLYQMLNYIDQVEAQNVERQKQMEEQEALEKSAVETVIEAQPVEVVSE